MFFLNSHGITKTSSTFFLYKAISTNSTSNKKAQCLLHIVCIALGIHPLTQGEVFTRITGKVGVYLRLLTFLSGRNALWWKRYVEGEFSYYLNIIRKQQHIESTDRKPYCKRSQNDYIISLHFSSALSSLQFQVQDHNNPINNQ